MCPGTESIEQRFLVQSPLYNVLPAKVQTLSSEPPASQLQAATDFLTYQKKTVTLPPWRMTSRPSGRGSF
jgi:hypothetical protein